MGLGDAPGRGITMETTRTFHPARPWPCADPVRYGVAALLIGSLLASTLPVSTHAQIVRDNSLGAMKNQPLTGPNFAITHDLGEIKGTNLFHSFSEFNLRTLPDTTIESATFTGPATIGNILTRERGKPVNS